jgi:hypothetical protein
MAVCLPGCLLPNYSSCPAWHPLLTPPSQQPLQHPLPSSGTSGATPSMSTTPAAAAAVGPTAPGSVRSTTAAVPSKVVLAGWMVCHSSCRGWSWCSTWSAAVAWQRRTPAAALPRFGRGMWAASRPTWASGVQVGWTVLCGVCCVALPFLPDVFCAVTQGAPRCFVPCRACI